ncbi:MAG TPA: ATP-binding protein [Candidatus Saccharimonadales bacterium]|nr:ATP-binding protein [Candidatus Saccharimonadales bacterium]
MQIEVANRWYRLYNWILLSISAVLLVSAVIVHADHSLLKYSVLFGLTPFTGVLALAYLINGSLVYFWVAKKQSHFHAALLSGLVFLVNELNLLSTTSSRPLLIYILIFFFMTAFSGIFGLEVILEWNFLATFFVLFAIRFNVSLITAELGMLLAGSYVLSFVFYFLIWKTIYNKSKSHELQRFSRLSSMFKDNKSQSEILVESIADGVIVFDNERNISLMNQSAARMTGNAVKDSMGTDINQVVKLASDKGIGLGPEQSPFKIAIDNRAASDQTLTLISKQQKKLTVSLVISPVILPNEQEKVLVGGVAILRDISVQKQAEQQRADFISTASHEMRTPVAAIEGYLSLAMNDRVSNIDSKARGYLEKAHESTRQLGKLFQDLLTSSKAEDGRLVNHPVVVEMGEFTAKMNENLQLAAQKKSLFVELINNTEVNPAQAAPAGKPTIPKPLYYVFIDPDRMREVITNLFDNAMKYTESGKITLGIGGTKDTVEFFIKDTGFGIPPEDLPHLFQKFYRVDSSAVRTIGGTGLGLYICRKIVELYKGKIWAASEIGTGSVFHISLPRLSNAQAQELKNRQSTGNKVEMPATNST